MNDLVHLAMRKAAEKFGDPVLFNAACFSFCLCEIAGVKGPLDGLVVRAVLCGRGDVEVLAGGAHFRLVEVEVKRGGE